MFSFRFSWFFLVLRWGNGIGDLGPSWTIHHRNPKRCHQDCNATDFEIDTCGSPHWNPTWLKNIVNKKHPYMQDSAPKSCPCLSEVWHGVPLWDDRHCIFLSTTGAGGWGICGSGWSKTVIILGKKLASVDASGGNTQKRVSRSKTTERTRGPGIWRWGTGGREKKGSTIFHLHATRRPLFSAACCVHIRKTYQNVLVSLSTHCFPLMPVTYLNPLKPPASHAWECCGEQSGSPTITTSWRGEWRLRNGQDANVRQCVDSGTLECLAKFILDCYGILL